MVYRLYWWWTISGYSFARVTVSMCILAKWDGLDDWSDDSLERLTPVMDENPKLHLKDALDIMAICNF